MGFNWWPCLICMATWPMRWCLCLNLRPQYKHGCFGSWPHSRRICLRREIIQRYTFLHRGQEKSSCSFPSAGTPNPAVCWPKSSVLISSWALSISSSTSKTKWSAKINHMKVLEWKNISKPLVQKIHWNFDGKLLKTNCIINT